MSLTDFHSHILPGVDDGSKDLPQTLEMLRRSADQGIRRMVATPHFYPRHDDPDRFLSRRQAAWEQLKGALLPDLPEIILGAEVHYWPRMAQSDVLRSLAIEGTDHILVELPTSKWTDSIYRDLEQIRDEQGLTPIVAHVDRYISPFATHGIPEALSELPVLVQANAEFFLRRTTAALAFKLLRREQIHLLGSDCHDLDKRHPNLGPALDAIRRRLGSDALDHIRRCEAEVF